MVARYRRTFGAPRVPRSIATNTASVKEAYSISVPDGIVSFGRAFSLAQPTFDRAQTVAQAYQEYRMKYIKLTFRPLSDTFQPIVGNSIPQLYYMIDKTNAIPTTADSGTFFSMGCRPHRFDDKNIVVAWKPTTIISTLTAPAQATANQVQERPWLSTNANAYNPAAGWAPSVVDHLGIVFYVTKINATDDILYNVDVEIVFQFRKPNWKAEPPGESTVARVTFDITKPAAVSGASAPTG